MAAHDLGDLLSGIITEVRPRMLQAGFGLDSCVAATRIALDILDYFGVIGAKPVPVLLQAWNREAFLLLKEHEGNMEEVADIIAGYDVADVGGPWNVGIGYEEAQTRRPGDPGAGHVIVGIPERGVALDLALDQAARPQKRMLLTPVWFHVSEGWLTHEEQNEFVAFPVTESVDAEPDVLLVYQHAESRFLRSPNWRRDGRGNTREMFREVTGGAIRALKTQFG